MNIREAITASGGLSAAARLMGVSRQFVLAVREGKRPLPAKRAVRLAIAMPELDLWHLASETVPPYFADALSIADATVRDAIEARCAAITYRNHMWNDTSTAIAPIRAELAYLESRGEDASYRVIRDGTLLRFEERTP